MDLIDVLNVSHWGRGKVEGRSIYVCFCLHVDDINVYETYIFPHVLRILRTVPVPTVRVDVNVCIVYFYLGSVLKAR